MTATDTTPLVGGARLTAYARLVLQVGVGLEPGQDLLVESHLDHAPLARALTVEAYAHGARFVDVRYFDPYLRRAQAEGASDEMLQHAPQWAVDRLRRATDGGAAVVAISGGSDADVFSGVDEARLTRTRPKALDDTWIGVALGRRTPWAIIGCPTERWAREVFGEPDVERLWQALAVTLRLDEPDPVAAWRDRVDELQVRAAALTERGFATVRYRGPGTELDVRLLEGGRWMAAGESTLDGHPYVPNMPSEEVFTTPHRGGANGVVRASMPLALRGTMVEGLELRLVDGEIVDVRATRGAEAVQAELAADEGARRLGELALVDGSSRVAATGIVFRNTLLDENAASHIAWGQGLPWVLPGVPADELEEHGLNMSGVHTDFMIGSPELDVDGVDAEGATIPILRGGEWQLPS
jgi:aminopeptidase